MNRNLRKEEVIDMKTEISKSCQEEVRPRTDNQLPQTFYEKSLEVGEGPSAEQGEVQERIFWHVQDLNFPEHGHPNSIGAGDCWSEREGEQGSYFLADEASQKPVVFSSLSDTGMVGCQRIKQEPDDHDQGRSSWIWYFDYYLFSSCRTNEFSVFFQDSSLNIIQFVEYNCNQGVLRKMK